MKKNQTNKQKSGVLNWLWIVKGFFYSSNRNRGCRWNIVAEWTNTPECEPSVRNSPSAPSRNPQQTSGPTRGASVEARGRERWAERRKGSQTCCKGQRRELTVHKYRCGCSRSAPGQLWQVWTCSLDEISPDCSQHPRRRGGGGGGGGGGGRGEGWGAVMAV